MLHYLHDPPRQRDWSGNKEGRNFRGADPVTERSSSDHRFDRSIRVNYFPSFKGTAPLALRHLSQNRFGGFRHPRSFFLPPQIDPLHEPVCLRPHDLLSNLEGLHPLFRSKGLSSGTAFLFVSIMLFYLGAFFCFFITLPFGVQFLLGYQSAHIKPMISAGNMFPFAPSSSLGLG